MHLNGSLEFSQLMKTAREHREDILKGEIGALLHDTGKLMEDFFLGSEKRDVYLIGAATLPLLKEFLLHEDVLARVDKKNIGIDKMKEEWNGELDSHYRGSLLTKFQPAGDFFRTTSINAVPGKDGTAMTLEELVAFGRDYTYLSADVAAEVLPGKVWAAEILGLTHSLAHMEKQDIDDILSQNGVTGPVYVSTPFGSHYKKTVNIHGNDGQVSATPLSLEDIRNNVFTAATRYVTQTLSGESLSTDNVWEGRKVFLKELKDHLQETLADTRVLLNEVSLWDWGHTAAFLFKPMLAYAYDRAADGYIQEQRPLFMDIWPGFAVLRVNLDRSKLLARAVRLPDVAYFSSAVEEAFDKVKKLLEVEYPVAGEVFRDDKGIYFLLPGALVLDELARDKIAFCFSSVDDLLPLLLDIKLEHVTGTGLQELNSALPPGVGADFSDRRQNEYKKLLQQLMANFFLRIMAGGRVAAVQPGGCLEIKKTLAQMQGGGSLTCPVCRVRLKPASGDIDTCSVCRNNRSSVRPASNDNSFSLPISPPSPWSGEIAGRDRRAALLSLHLPLAWLVENGDCMFLPKGKGKTPVSNGALLFKHTTKNITPTRLSRMRAVINDFLEELLHTFITAKGDSSWKRDLRCSRLVLTHNGAVSGDGDDVDEILLFNPRENWEIPLEKVRKEYVSTDNLTRFCRGGQKGEQRLMQALCDLVQAGISPADKSWQILKKKGMTKTPLPGDFTGRIEHYTPCRVIYRDDLRLLVMLPAVEVSSFAEYAFSAYQREFSQVQNRLPLKLGAVFLRDRTPVGAALEALNRWHGNLERLTGREYEATVLAVDDLPHYPLPGVPPDQAASLHARKVSVQIPRLGLVETITAADFAFSGQDCTQVVQDSFYPLWQGKEELIPLAELAAGNTVSCSPSTFSYIVLDSVAGRFDNMEERTILVADFIRLYTSFQQMKKQRGFVLRMLRSYQMLEQKAGALGLFSGEQRDMDLLRDDGGVVFLKLAEALFWREEFKRGKGQAGLIFDQTLPPGPGKVLRYDWFVFMHNLFLKVMKEEEQDISTGGML